MDAIWKVLRMEIQPVTKMDNVPASVMSQAENVTFVKLDIKGSQIVMVNWGCTTLKVLILKVLFFRHRNSWILWSSKATSWLRWRLDKNKWKMLQGIDRKSFVVQSYRRMWSLGWKTSWTNECWRARSCCCSSESISWYWKILDRIDWQRNWRQVKIFCMQSSHQ